MIYEAETHQLIVRPGRTNQLAVRVSWESVLVCACDCIGTAEGV